MTQRARLYGTSVYAFKADDAEWASLKQRSKDGQLTLPCCSGTAIPRQHPISSTRFFSHAPYAARTCAWKAVGALHEDLVLHACAILLKMGWLVETDCWLESVSIDILATHPENGDQVAIMIETASRTDRPAETLIAENGALQETTLRSVLWFVPSNRYGILEQSLLALPYQRSEQYAENTIGIVADLLSTWLEHIDTIAPMQVNADQTRTRLRDIALPYPVEDLPTNSVDATTITNDPEWHDGVNSVGSPRVRTDRLIRLAHKWLGDDDAFEWLNRTDPDLGDTPIGASQGSANGYICAQNILRTAVSPNELSTRKCAKFRKI